MNKFERQGTILRLVGERQLATQSDVVEALRDEGLDAVQATVSRDIAQLGLVKVRGDDGRLVYALPGAADLDRLSELTSALRRWATSLEPHREPRRRQDAAPATRTRSRTPSTRPGCPRSRAASPATTRSSSPRVTG